MITFLDKFSCRLLNLRCVDSFGSFQNAGAQRSPQACSMRLLRQATAQRSILNPEIGR